MFDKLSKSIASRALRSDAGRALLDKAVRDYLGSEAGSEIAGVLVSPFDSGRAAEWQDDPAKQVKHLKGWVFTAVNAIIRGVTSVPLRFYSVGEDGKREEVEFSHPIRELFRRVNNAQTFRDLMAALVVHSELTGNAYWSISREDGTPTELWTLPSQYTRVVPSNEEWIAGYTLKRNGRKKFYKAENVLHFVLYANPDSLYYGKSPLQAAAEAVDADEGISESQYRHFAKGLHPDQIKLHTDQTLTPAQVSRWRRELQAGYASTSRSSSVFIEHGGVTLDLTSLKPRDMDYLDSSISTRQRILAIFGVPEFIAGIPEGTNRSSAQVAEYIFSKYTVEPKLRYVEGIVTECLCPMFGPNLVAEFDSPVPKDDEARAKQVTMFWNDGILTLNETRSELGYDAVEGEEGGKRKPPPQRSVQMSVPALPQEVVKQEPPPTEEELDAILSFIFDRDAEAAHFESALGGRVADALKQGASLEAARIGREVDVDRPEFLADLMERSRGRWDETVGETTIKGLKTTLAEGLAANESGPQLTSRVRKLFRETYANRATTIARTEVVSAANAGALRAGELAGMTRKVWIATLDEYTRPDHLAADGQEVGIDESFKVGDDSLRYPGDPMGSPSQIISCRCSMSSVLGAEKSFYRAVDKAFRAAEWKLERKAEADVARYFREAGDRVDAKLQEWLREREEARHGG